ncbi:hypothetical protein C8R44DRAFT_985809 [Mycena epipterygia]|nr:hypothetical protein C8R44DRAFT_985809 [Mycena epipterygia]
MLKEDRVRLNQTVTALSLAIQLAWLPGPQAAAPVSPLDLIDNHEVKAFWRQMIGESGASSFRCPLNVFRSALSNWIGSDISIPDTLMFQLDEQGFGSVTPSSFSRFVGTQSVVHAISQKTRSVLSTPQGIPLIVWVSEDLEIYRSNIEYAESLGIKVVSFSSLAAVTSWMELNEPFVRAVAGSHRLRFVSDATRNEGGIFNPAAGELLLRHIRGYALPSPCLIFAPTVATTGYVLAYTRAGSTADPHIVRGYIKALADGVRDVEWVGFDVRSGGEAAEWQPAAQTGAAHRCFNVKPLLVYVTGTKPAQDQVNIDYAASLGLTVVSLFSTVQLRQYLETNQDELRRMATAHRLRFITQNVRLENGVPVLGAGEDAMKCVRAQGLAAPVLVLSTSSIAGTRFVASYGRAGSTTDARVVRGFVEALAAGVRDTEWVGFDRKFGAAAE